MRENEEASVVWLWTALVAWAPLAVPVAVLLGQAIRRADRRELGESDLPPCGRDTPSDRPEVPSR